MRLMHVVGARPNFMKIAPILAEFKRRGGAEQRLVHTGQHYDAAMSDVFFRDLGIPAPDVFLGVGSGTHAQQTAKLMTALETTLTDWRPDLLVVAGDVNSTLAAALVASKLTPAVPVAHVESGLRSRDWTMPEEVNRVLVDRLSALCLTPSRDADANLAAEGIEPARIRFVGNVMIDSLRATEGAIREAAPGVLARLGVEKGRFAVATLHRPANVDDPAMLLTIVRALLRVGRELPVVFPVHPRTLARLKEGPAAAEIVSRGGVIPVEPAPYVEFQAMLANAKLVLTDSGGIQEETTALGVPCLTLRDNTERPVTVDEGTNVLVGRDPARIWPAVDAILSGRTKAGRVPEGWDGRAAARVADVVEEWFRTRV